MAKRKFTMQLHCSYEDPDNSVAQLSVEVLTQDGWQALDLSVASPGFQIFVYSVFICQHMYFRTNCAERRLMLEHSDGNLLLVTDKEWNIEELEIEFIGFLKSGTPSQRDIDYIVERMKQCPVSKNLRKIPRINTTVRFTA